MAAVTLLVVVLIFAASCAAPTYGQMVTLELESAYLGKMMRPSVLLPPGYVEGGEYSVLYFVPDGGGGAALITGAISTDPACIDVLRAHDPLVVVGVPHDGSFLLDSPPPHTSMTTSSGLTLQQGYYESYFLNELLPLVEETYTPGLSADRRSIGGYSLGGYAALRIALSDLQLFSIVGAHSPTLVADTLPDQAVTDFMYPSEELRFVRDPLRMPIVAGSLATAAFHLDTGATDVNRVGCDLMAARLTEAGAETDCQILPGIHGRNYLFTHLPRYLDFYTG